MIICDLPFLSYQCGEEQAMAVAGELLKESSAAAVKLEGAEPEIIAVICRSGWFEWEFPSWVT